MKDFNPPERVVESMVVFDHVLTKRERRNWYWYLASTDDPTLTALRFRHRLFSSYIRSLPWWRRWHWRKR